MRGALSLPQTTDKLNGGALAVIWQKARPAAVLHRCLRVYALFPLHPG